jgi:hypothetical protein
MRLSDAGLRRHQTKLIDPHHRHPPWLTEDAARDRSNRLLDCRAMRSSKLTLTGPHQLTCPLHGAQNLTLHAARQRRTQPAEYCATLKVRALWRRPPAAPAPVRAAQPRSRSTPTDDAESRGSKGTSNRAVSVNLRILQSINQGLSNDEVERRGFASTRNEAALSQSSTPSLAHRSYFPRDRSNRLLDAGSNG